MENLPSLKVIIESLTTDFQEHSNPLIQIERGQSGVLFETVARGAGFLITVTAQILSPKTDKRSLCESCAVAKYYVEVSDRRIFVRIQQQIAVQFIAEIGSQTLCYAKLVMKQEFEKRGFESFRVPYQSFSQLYPQVEQYIQNTPLYQLT